MKRRELTSFTAHVYIYNALYRVTDEGRDIFLAQGIFMVLYLLTLSFVILCYRLARVSPHQALRIYTFFKVVELKTLNRHLPIFSRSSFSQNGYIASSSYDSSMIVLPCSHCS